MSKILLVDDDEFVVEYLKTHLEEWGYGIVEVSGGRSAINMAVSDTANLIIMDINMPGITGYEAIEELKSNSRNAEIPIIALTANKKGVSDDWAYLAHLIKTTDTWIILPHLITYRWMVGFKNVFT